MIRLPGACWECVFFCSMLSIPRWVCVWKVIWISLSSSPPPLPHDYGACAPLPACLVREGAAGTSLKAVVRVPPVLAHMEFGPAIVAQTQW